MEGRSTIHAGLLIEYRDSDTEYWKLVSSGEHEGWTDQTIAEAQRAGERKEKAVAAILKM